MPGNLEMLQNNMLLTYSSWHLIHLHLKLALTQSLPRECFITFMFFVCLFFAFFKLVDGESESGFFYLWNVHLVKLKLLHDESRAVHSKSQVMLFQFCK